MKQKTRSETQVGGGENVSLNKRRFVSNLATGKQLAAVSDLDHALLRKATGNARRAFPGWSAVPFGRRKAILAASFNKINDHADELSALLTAEQGGPLAQARWEIDLLAKGFGPALMQMELPQKEQNGQPMQHSIQRYFSTDAHGVISRWNLPVLLSFGKVFPALLRGDTVVLRPSALTPLTVLRISEYIRQFFPAGVFNVVTGSLDYWPSVTSHSGIELITFTTSTNIRPAVKSDAGAIKPDRLELGGNDFRTNADADPEKIARRGNIALLPVNLLSERCGLARTLFEILSFSPVTMRTQVLVWSLARKASYDFLRVVRPTLA